MNNFTDYEKDAAQSTKLNPFTSVWLHPKQTARYIMDAKSVGYAIFILSIGYIGSLLTGITGVDLPAWGMILLSIILAPIVGTIGTSLSALVFWLVGKLFKGTGTFSELFKALGLTAIPFIVIVPIYIVWLLISPDSLIITDDTWPLPWSFWVTNFITIVLSIWCFVISVAAVAEAHRFSNWKAFFTIFLPSIIFGLVIFAIMVIVVVGIFSSYS